MIGRPTSISWFASHELRLVWRDWIRMIMGGKRMRGIVVVIGLIAFALLLHLMADLLIGPRVAEGIRPDKPTLVLLTGGGFLLWTVMLSQAMESVTRGYYARSDLDLILSSPASPRRLFAVRAAAIALSTSVLSCLLASPIVDMLVFRDGPRWLAAYGVLAAMGALSAALAILATIGLFRLVGPKRTRVLAQVIAAIIGASFVIGVQAAAILAYGDLSRFAVLQSDAWVGVAPDAGNVIWLPARAAMGDGTALIMVTVMCLGSLAIAIGVASSSFAHDAICAAGVSQTRTPQKQQDKRFRHTSQKHALRLKEWKLLMRDPWLISQVLMQILYLLPPALLLWVNYRATTTVLVIIVPVLVMAAGQLAGGLAWLAVSGEDAHDLVITAPLAPRAVLTAKIEAVIAVIGLLLAPLLLLIGLQSIWTAVVTAVGVALSAASATAIQLWFCTPMRRLMFRRRQVASRTATIAEALSSIMWAATAGLVAAGSWMIAVLPALLALTVLGIARAIRPRNAFRALSAV